MRKDRKLVSRSQEQNKERQVYPKMKSLVEYFGFEPGSDRHIIHWETLCAFYRYLAENSDRVKTIEKGKTTLGRPFLEVIITAPENMEKLEEYRQMSMAAADPRGLDEEAIRKICTQGKAVCMQSMSLHADEIGGAQMAPRLAYHLATSDSQEVREILENVIFIMVPSFNPDGLDMVAEWYEKTLNTPYEGTSYPKLWHVYAGHSNNRDGIAENLQESRLFNDILLREWMPQAYQDHHHQGAFDARFYIAPYKNPVRPYCSPLIWRELAFYGANMAYRLEEAGVQGVISGEIYPCRGHFGFHYMVNSHNIAGMLTESASAKLASPMTVQKEQLNNNVESTLCPNPWQGGEWHLSDIVRQQYIAAMGLLSTMAKNREPVLRNMVNKALRQTKAGAENPIQAFLIPPEQDDPSASEKFIHILQRQGIELYTADEPIKTRFATYPKGTVVVPLAQPKYGVVMTLLGRSDYPQNDFTRNKDGAITAYDVMTDCLAEYMGVRVIEAGCEVAVKLVPFAGFERKELSAQENDSFRLVNQLLADGKDVFRDEKGNFHAEIQPEGSKKLIPARIGIYQNRWGGNTDEAYTRLLLNQYGFVYQTVEPNRMVSALENLDVLIIPDTSPSFLRGKNVDVENILPEYRYWMGEAEEEAIRAFVKRGGRVIAFSAASMYAADVLKLNLINRVEKISATQFNTHGSTLHVSYAKTPLTVGMPENGLVLQIWGAPVFEITDYYHADNYRVDARFAETKVLESGLLIGEEYLAGRPAMLTVKYGAGEAVLFGFSPQFRAQTDGTYKLLFNALYQSSGRIQ